MRRCDLGTNERDFVTSLLTESALRLLNQYRWKFQEKEGQSTTVASQREYELKGGESNTANDCLCLINVRVGSSRNYLNLISKDEYDQSQTGLSSDAGTTDQYYISGADNKYNPKIGLNGSITGSETIYYRYYKREKENIIDSLPEGFATFLFHDAMSTHHIDGTVIAKHENKAQDALSYILHNYRDLTVKSPEVPTFSIQERKRICRANRRHRR